MKAKPTSGGGGAKPTPKKTVQSMREAAKTIKKTSAKSSGILKGANRSGSGTPTRASATTATSYCRDVGTPYVAKPKNPRGNVDATRYGRKVGTPYVPKPKQMPKTY
jgi:hypothetical protein